MRWLKGRLLLTRQILLSVLSTVSMSATAVKNKKTKLAQPNWAALLVNCAK